MEKIVLITGASSGVGEELKKYYENDGDVVVNLSIDVKEEDKKNYKLDVSSREQVFEVIDKVFRKMKREGIFLYAFLLTL